MNTPSTVERRSRRLPALAASGALVALAACFNIYVQFPTAELSQLAEDYTRRAYAGESLSAEPKADEAGTESKPPTERSDGGSGGPNERKDESGRLFGGLLPVVHAAEGGIDVKIDSPAIRAIQEQQAARLKKLRPHFEAGRIGTASNGDVVIRNEDGIDIKAKKDVREWVAAENKSRTELYAEVARANKLEPSRVEEIRKIWAAAWIEEAPPGYWVQVDGKWQQKPPKK